MIILSVAEKPSVARELANIIGKGTAVRRNGHSPYNHVFDIAQCEFMGRPASMRITSVTGHVMGLEFDSKYKNWQGVNPEHLFRAEISKTIPQDKRGIQLTLEEEARQSSVLLLWLDCDLEGENIAYEVIDITTKVNRRLDIYRARFSALIPRDVFRTMQNPERPNKNMSDAVDARQEIDLRLGAAFTRFQTIRLQERFGALKDNVISYGPCQFPTLGFVVERYLQIKKFVPEDYWSISCYLETPDKDERNGILTTNFFWERGRLFDHLSCFILYEMCVESGIAVVTESKSNPTSRMSPCPLNTVELQKLCSRFFHMSSENTMQVAESLYQRGILSYPRTETDFFKEGFEIHQLLEEHRGHEMWGEYVTMLLDNGKFRWPRKGGHDDQAHPPIHPTKSVALDSLTDPKERQLYELVARHFFACCSFDATGQQSTIRMKTARSVGEVLPEYRSRTSDSVTRNSPTSQWLGDGETFTATGVMIEERNWLEVYSKWEKWVGNKIAPLHVGDVVKPTSIQMTTCKTQPPFPLTESDLISAMDRNGIGTDATIAQHISTILDRKYAFKNESGHFIPSDLGIGLVEGYNQMGYHLNKPALRASMEKDCQAVAHGRMRREDMVRNCLDQMKECFRSCVREAHQLDSSIGKYFLGIGRESSAQYEVVSNNLVECTTCRNGMDLKKEIQQPNSRVYPKRFLFCAECQQALPVPKSGTLSKRDDECPICSYSVLNVLNVETQKSHTVCPYCYSNPPSEHSDASGSGEFRCFACSHPSCALAGNHSKVLSACFASNCSGTLNLRRVEGKGWVASCSEYPGCKSSWWLPKCVKTADISTTKACAKCSQQLNGKGEVREMKLALTRHLAPPGIPSLITACPSCSSIWGELEHSKLRLPQTLAKERSSQAFGEVKSTSMEGHHTVDSSLNRQQIADTKKNSTSFKEGQYDKKCDCGNSAVQKSVRNGPNIGKVFFTCSKPREQQCRFFEWLDDGHIEHSSNQLTNIQPQPRSVMGDASLPSCECGQVAVRFTVNKAGPNLGRNFFKCAKPQGQQCRFFSWEDSNDVSVAVSHVHHEQSLNRSGNQRNGAKFVADIICSRCKTPGHYARSCPKK